MTARAVMVLLVTDIDRGGAFAHLYGTPQLLPINERTLLRGFVLNKFRGDASLLAPGLGLLPPVTQFDAAKLLRPSRVRFAALQGPWQALSHVAWSGYEIHHGRTVQHAGLPAAAQALTSDSGEVIGWSQGSVLAIYAHGLFESPAVMRALFGLDVPLLDSVFDGLADFVDQHFDAGALTGLLKSARQP